MVRSQQLRPYVGGRAGAGWGKIEAVRFLEQVNAFVTEGRYVYAFPASLGRLESHFCFDRPTGGIGFAKGAEERVIIGSPPDGSRVVGILTLIDGFYFGMIVGNGPWNEHYRIAGGFEPLQASEAIGPVTNVTGFVSYGFVVGD